MAQRDLVFISYAHEDRKWLADLRTFLKPFEKQGKLKVWADPHIAVGAGGIARSTRRWPDEGRCGPRDAGLRCLGFHRR